MTSQRSIQRGEQVTAGQVAIARAVTAWYLHAYHCGEDDLGTARTFTDPSRVGHFAVDADALASGEPNALFKLLIACTMFQRRQDQQILRVLRGIPAREVVDLSDAQSLLHRADNSPCHHLASTTSLKDGCDLSKDPATSEGRCSAMPGAPCHLKRHSRLLKRYGHFGKVPTSVALAVREAGAEDLADLYRQALAAKMSPRERAEHLEMSLTRAWRVSDKISAMYLSILCNPDLSMGPAPWSDGVDWTRYVAIDSNVDLFIEQIGYRGRGTYPARRSFIQRLSKRIKLSELKPGLNDYNPRLVQQAAYVFMSKSNRRANERDCSRVSPPPCGGCPVAMRRLCSSRPIEEQ